MAWFFSSAGGLVFFKHWPTFFLTFAIREMFTAEFATADMTAIVENIFEDGQWAILEWKDPLGLRGCGFFHVVNGKILFQRGYWDKLSFLKQHNLPIEY